MEQKLSEKKRFSIIARVRSTNNAMRGLEVLLKTTHNFWMHLLGAALATYLGIILHLSEAEWGILILTIALVLVTETINTAFEIDIDLTSPGYHPYARDAKDVAAAAVTLAVVASGIIGMVIFLPKILALYM